MLARLLAFAAGAVKVAPVTSGERLVAITFVQSHIAEETRRNTLYELNEVLALEGLKMSWQNRIRLEAVSNNLMRQWASELRLKLPRSRARSRSPNP